MRHTTGINSGCAEGEERELEGKSVGEVRKFGRKGNDTRRGRKEAQGDPESDGGMHSNSPNVLGYYFSFIAHITPPRSGDKRSTG